MELPQTLHTQLYLLTYDRKRHRFLEYLPLFGFALRAAMLTDLYLTGHLEDKDGKAWPATAARPADPVLRTVLMRAPGREWVELISTPRAAWTTIYLREGHDRRVVREQLEATGWLRVERHRMLGVIPSSRLALYDEDIVNGLADRVTGALRRAIDGLAADPRPLAVGLLGVLGQLPTVLSFKESAQHREALREMTFAAIEPILGLHEAIQKHHTDMRSRWLGW